MGAEILTAIPGPVEANGVSDETLARETRTGSLAAFEELVCRYENRIYGFVAHSCRNAADAQEITQDIFVRAFQAIAQFDPRHSFAGWLFAIARHKCIDHYRGAPASAGPAVPELCDLEDPAELLARDDDKQSLWRLARRSLPQLQFQAIWLRYAEDMSVAHIARVLCKTRPHVKVLLFRARRALARELERDGALITAGARLRSAPAVSRPAPETAAAITRHEPALKGSSA